MDEVGVREIEHFKAALFKDERSPKTVRNILAVLSKMLRYAEELELIDKAPRVRFPRVPEQQFDFLDFDEAERLLASSLEHEVEWHTMIFTALRTGLRFGELIELKWSDVDLVTGRLTVNRNFTRHKVTTPKSGKTRRLPLSPETVQTLKAHRHLRSELVFCNEDGSRITNRCANLAIKRACKRAGLRPVGFHNMRHSFASHLVMRGVPLKSVQELLGHATISMTMRYAHLAPRVNREAVTKLDLPAPQRPYDGHTDPPVGEVVELKGV